MSLSKLKRRALGAWERIFRHYLSRSYERMPWAASNYGTMHEVVHVTVSVTPPPGASEDDDDYAGGGVAIFNAFRRRNSYRRLLDRSGSVDVLLDSGSSLGCGGGGGGWRRLRKSASEDAGVGGGDGLDGRGGGRPSPRTSVSAQLARLLDFRRISDSLGGERKRPPSRETTPAADGEMGCAAKGSPTMRRHRLRNRRRASSTTSTAAATASSPLKRVLQSFGSLYRTVSAEGSKSVSPPPPSCRRILRTPAAYAYVRGLSGLATQRIPTKRSPRGCHPPCCSTVPIHFYMPGP